MAFISTLATHAAIALANAELFEQTTARAAQLEVLQTASARMSRAVTVEEVARTVVEETHGIIDYHNARVYLVELPDAVVPIAFEGRLGAYEHVDMALLECRLGEGFTGWVAQHGEPILLNDTNHDPRGATIAGTEDIDESMLVVPMRYDGATIGVITLSKLGLDGFGSDDLRLLTILADRAATAIGSVRLLTRAQGLALELRRLLDMSGELSGSLDPHQVAEVMAGHLARAMGVGECIISYWDRDAGRVESLGYYPAHRIRDIEPSYEVGGFPETLRVLERQVEVIVDVDDPIADPAEVELMRQDGNRVLAMLPLVVKGQSIGLVELVSDVPVTFDDERLALARTMANEAAMALENARLYEDARKLADRDPLTGFYNHRFLHERLGEEVIRAQRGRRPLSMLMLDLDDFKLVNDTFGHLFGDRVLTWTAELIRSTLRGSDIPARYGGDEFAIMLPDTDGDDARRAAERILEAFRDHAYVGEQRGPVPIGASIGVATFPADGRNATDLIAAADKRPVPGQARRRPRRRRGRGHRRSLTTGRIGRRYRSPAAIRTRAGDGRRRSRPPSLIPDVSDTPSRPTRATDTPEARTRRAWWIFATSFFILGLIARPPDRHGTVASGRLGHRGARPRRRLRGHPASPDGHRARGRPPRGGRILRAHPVQPVALGLARRDPRRDRRRAGHGHRGRPHRRGATPARCTRPRGDAWSAPGRACPIRRPACRSPTWRTRSTAAARASASPWRSRSPRPRPRRSRPAPCAAGSTTSPRDWRLPRRSAARPPRPMPTRGSRPRTRRSPTGSRCGPTRSTV